MTATPTTTRRLTAIVVADVVGYARLLGEDEAGTLAALRERRKAVVEPLTKQHSGRVVKFLGDGVLIEFSSAVNAVAFALDLQRRMVEMNEPVAESRRIRLRVGINLGEVVGEGPDIFGDGVNIASRLEVLAEPGGICISAKVHEEVRGKLDLRAEDLGERSLKNIASPVRCWRISAPRSASTAVPAPVDNRTSIAVLPFTNMSGDATQDNFVDGLTEDLITALAKFRFFSVLSRNTTFQFKGRSVDIQAVGRQLGVRYVLEGSIRTGSNRIRVTAQLIEVESGIHVWAERFDREMADVFAVQDEIVAAIVGPLLGRIVDAAVAAGLRTPKGALTAHDHYLRCLSAWRRGAAEETLDHLLKAVDADPDSAPVLGFLAFFYAEDIWMQVTGKSIAELEKLALSFADRANLADTGDADVHLEIGTAFFDLGDLDRARQHLELSLAFNPHETSAKINLGLTIVCMGAHSEGLAVMERALRLDPRMAPAMQAVPFYAHCIIGSAEAAKRYLAAIRNPFAWNHLVMAAIFAQADRNEEARDQLAEFESKRTAWFDTTGLARWMARCVRLPEDKARLLDGFRKLGFEV